MNITTQKVVGLVLVTCIWLVLCFLIMSVDRHPVLTGYSVNFTLRDKDSSFEVVNLTKAHSETVDAKMTNDGSDPLNFGQPAIFVIEDAEGNQYVSQPVVPENKNSWTVQSFQGTISWGKYSIIDTHYVDITLSSPNPIKVTVNYSNWDQFWRSFFLLLVVTVIYFFVFAMVSST